MESVATIDTGKKSTAWVLLGSALAANAAGYQFGLWTNPAWFDEAVHGFTLFALTLVVGLYLYGRVLAGARAHPLLLTLSVAAVGLGIGGLWEVMEWAYDHWFAAGNVILGKWDTVTDLVHDTLGALLAGVVATAMARR